MANSNNMKVFRGRNHWRHWLRSLILLRLIIDRQRRDWWLSRTLPRGTPPLGLTQSVIYTAAARTPVHLPLRLYDYVSYPRGYLFVYSVGNFRTKKSRLFLFFWWGRIVLNANFKCWSTNIAVSLIEVYQLWGALTLKWLFNYNSAGDI